MIRKLFLLLLIASATTAHANLILHVSPDGTGTRWQFSGSAVTSTSGGSNSFWGENSGSLVNTFSGSYGILTGTGSMGSTSDPSNSINTSWASGHTFDGLSVRNGSISWLAGDTLFWDGDITTALPFAHLNVGSLTTTTLRHANLSSGALMITVSNSALTVPESGATLALFGLALAGLGLGRRFLG